MSDYTDFRCKRSAMVISKMENKTIKALSALIFGETPSLTMEYIFSGRVVDPTPGDEKSDDKIIKGEGKGQQRRGNDPRQQLRNRHLEEGGPFVGTEIHGSLLERAIHALQSGPHDQHHKGNIKGHVGDNDGGEAQVDVDQSQKRSPVKCPRRSPA